MNTGNNIDLYSSDVLTQNFYKWEVRGRGWSVWDFPVSLEPPFIPYGLPTGSTIRSSVDDGRHPTLLSSLKDKFKSAFSSHSISNSQVLIEDIDEDPEPIPFVDDAEIQELKIVLPADAEMSREYYEYFLLSLSSLSSPVSFEILGTSREITLHFSCRVQDILFLRQQIKSFFPQVIVTETESVTEKFQEGDLYTAVVDCGLSEEFMRPVKTFKQFDPDPLTTMYAALGELHDNEIGLVQVLFQSVDAPWATNILHAVRNDDGSSFFADAPEMIDLAEKKVSKPLFSVVLRLVGKSRTEEDALQIVRNLYRGLTPYADPVSNEFIPLENEGYEDNLHLVDVISRKTRRSGMILNNEELLSLIHLPSSSVFNPKLRREGTKSHSVPAIATGHGFVLGENVHQRIKTDVSLSIEQRFRHIHIIGKTGTGKSTLLCAMVTNSIRDSGVAVIDPHGDLIDRIIERIPEDRINDVILFDPGDTEYPVGFNILEAHSEIEKTVLSSDLVELFRRFSTSWGDQMTTVLSNAIIAIIESKEGGTLFELKRFLLEKEFREHLLKQGVDPAIVYFWEKEYPLLRGGSQVSIITRLDGFLRSKVTRNILTQNEGLNFKDIMEGKKIFLAKLSQGIIGEENSYLLGSLICSKFHQLAMGRQITEASKRTPFFLFIDEFHNFATPSLASMLSSSRKYSMGLILAQQSLSQIENRVLLNSVIANPMTRICFSLGYTDAHEMSSGSMHFNENDLMNLGVGEAIIRVERNEYDCNLKTFDLPEVSFEDAVAKREKIISVTRQKYGKKVSPIEIQNIQVTVSEDSNFPIKKREVSTIPADVKPHQDSIFEKKEESKNKPRQVFPRVSFSSEDEINRDILSQHRYLQMLIKKMAEQRGYRAVIEEPTPDRSGRVDVGLERDGKKIAIEISVTTGDTQELHNVEKCLKAGYENVVVCSSKKNLRSIRKLISEKLQKADLEKVKYFEPQGLFFFLDQQVAERQSHEQRMRGYRIGVKYVAVSESNRQQKREAVARAIVNAMRRTKK